MWIDELEQGREIPAKQVVNGQFVQPAAFAQVAQHLFETVRLDGFQLFQHAVQVGRQLQAGFIRED